MTPPTERFLQGLCDLKGDYAHQLDIKDPRTSWFKLKKEQGCLKVCGNCEYFTVAEFEVYPAQIAGEETFVGRVA